MRTAGHTRKFGGFELSRPGMASELQHFTLSKRNFIYMKSYIDNISSSFLSPLWASPFLIFKMGLGLAYMLLFDNGGLLLLGGQESLQLG